MEQTNTQVADGVKDVLVKVLQLEDRAASIDLSTPLLGSVPELDSMAVMELLVALEQRFNVTIGDDEVDADLFATVGTLVAFIESKRG